MTHRRLATTLTPGRSAGAQLESRRGELYIRDRDRDVIVAVNKSAAALWELCDGGTTLEEMVLAICELSSIPPERARADVERTLVELEGAGLVSFQP